MILVAKEDKPYPKPSPLMEQEAFHDIQHNADWLMQNSKRF